MKPLSNVGRNLRDRETPEEYLAKGGHVQQLPPGPGPATEPTATTRAARHAGPVVKKYNHVCLACKKPFSSEYSTARLCSDACRLARANEQKRAWALKNAPEAKPEAKPEVKPKSCVVCKNVFTPRVQMWKRQKCCGKACGKVSKARLKSKQYQAKKKAAEEAKRISHLAPTAEQLAAIEQQINGDAPPADPKYKIVVVGGDPRHWRNDLAIPADVDLCTYRANKGSPKPAQKAASAIRAGKVTAAAVMTAFMSHANSDTIRRACKSAGIPFRLIQTRRILEGFLADPSWRTPDA